MNAKERRNYIKTNTPRVRTMAAKLKLIDMPNRADRLLAMLASEHEWLRAIEITALYEKVLPALDYAPDPMEWWRDDVMDAIRSTLPIPNPSATLPRVKHGKSKADRINNLAAAQAARRRAKSELPPQEVIQIVRPKFDSSKLLGMDVSKLILDELHNLKAT